ncbi:putative ribosomal protein L19 [Rosellinia necatrix]|uniref:Putative ribosomal protein L19 n=1 Tax=Rosellinia necatrix TaxID=77044 RepID=A0A1W2TRT4_ROSNE|nr:putative ribosomal protein L19 [Rosellinia necatrix]
MSASTSSPTPPRRTRRLVRSKLRNGTWVIPNTGERTRIPFTFRSYSYDGPRNDDQIRSLTDGETIGEKARNVWHNLIVSLGQIWAWSRSPKGRGTIKCSIAYLLASLGTFWHPAAKFLGPMDGKHIVATIVTYFHPARTVGSQIEAVAIAIIAVCYAMLIGILSMATSVLIGDVLELEKLSYALILMVYIGFGLGFVGWVKQKLNNPLVSVGASIASIGIITIITKEGSIHNSVFSTDKIVQYLKILLMATIISTLVNLVLWPVSARHALRSSMRTASISLGQMLSKISSGFLSGAEEEFTSKSFMDASATYTSTLTLMNKNARESKYEYYFLGREQIYRHDKAVVKSMESLAQSIGGLRSAANTQFELLKEIATGPSSSSIPVSPGTNVFSPVFGQSFSSSVRSHRFGRLSSIDEASDERSDREDDPTPLAGELSPQRASFSSNFAPRSPSEIFELFIELLGPSMKSLVYTMAEILREPPFGKPGSPIELNEQFKHSLGEAVSLYNESRGKALEELYKKIESARSTSESVQADFEEVAAACGHFSFSLLSFADEMKKYLDSLEELKYISEEGKRTWNWLKVWNMVGSVLWKSRKTAEEDVEQQALIKPVKRMRQSQLPRGVPKVMKERRDTLRWKDAPADGLWSIIVQKTSPIIWRFLNFLTRDDIRFGLKVGIGATLYAMFAFIPETMDIYKHWRGEWGLLSFMIVCSMTVGASNATGLARFTGTIMGAVFVVINWLIADGNPVGLAILGWAVSFGAFFIMVDRGNAPFGRFILLSYNVSSLYAYSLSQAVEDDDDDEGGLNPRIRDIAFHRVVAVTIGILWGLIVCRLIWPLPARRKFKEGLAVLYLQMGLIWKRGPLAILLRNDATFTSYMKIGEQAAMQRYAAQLQTLRTAANNEYELRGPFPFAAYGRIMASTQRVLDAFHAMSLVTQKHGRLSEGEKALLNHTAEERAQLCARICHVFEVLASSMMLEYPLTDAIPSVIAIRDRLLGKIFRFRKEHSSSASGGPAAPGDETTTTATTTATTEHSNGKAAGTTTFMLGAMGQVPDLGDVTLEEPDYALLYAYALVTGQVAKELKVIEKELEGLFGRLDEDAMLLE